MKENPDRLVYTLNGTGQICAANQQVTEPTEYVKLSKVKELIEGNIKKYEALAEDKTAPIAVQHLMKARSLETLLEQLEGLE